LHLLWHAAVEQQEDGDLTKWTDELIAELAGYSGSAPQFVRLLQECGWFEGNTKMIHDWWDYAGRFLQSKYGHSPEKWQAIKEKHTQSVCKADEKRLHITKPNQPNIPNISSSQLALATLLRDRILGNNPKARIKDGQIEKWANTVRLMIENDKRTEAEVKTVIEWCQNDSFWKINILSMDKLREKFDQLWLKMKGNTPAQTVKKESRVVEAGCKECGWVGNIKLYPNHDICTISCKSCGRSALTLDSDYIAEAKCREEK